MEKVEFKQTPERRIKSFLQDYSNNFLSLRNFFKRSGINKVREIIRDGYMVPTVSEYLNQCREEERVSIEDEDKENSLFVEKEEKLNKLAEEINSIMDNDDIDEKRFSEILEELNNIIYK